MANGQPPAKQSVWDGDGWFLEVLSLVAAAGFLGAMVGLVVHYDGQNASDWPYPVTLNAFVAVLSLAAKACVMFAVCASLSQWKWILYTGRSHVLIDFERIDSSSRGPLGSVALLATSWKSGLVVRLGAIVTLLALALDPFTQQIIQLRQDVVFTPAERYAQNTRVGACAYYWDGSLNNSNSTTLTNGTRGELHTWEASTPTYVQAAVLDGLSRPMSQLQAQTPYLCPTADCRWPAFNSLAVCSRCSNTTSEITRIPGNSIDLYTAFAAQYGGRDMLGDNATAFRLPTGQFIANMDSYMEKSTGSNGAPPFLMSASGTGVPSRTLSLQESKSLIWSINILAIAPRHDDLSNKTKPVGGKWPEMGLVSGECGLYWCVNQYESVLRNNTLSERVTEQETTFNMPLDDIINRTWPFDGLQFKPTVVDTGIWPGHIGLCDTKKEGGFGCLNVSIDSVLSLNSYFQTLLTTGAPSANATAGLGQDALHNEGVLVNGRSVPTALSGIWTDASQGLQDLQSRFEALALSTTNAIRSSAMDAWDTSSVVPGSTKGTVGRTQTLFHMQWQWMTLHCTVFVLAIVFLLLTVTHPGRNRAPLWKSSALAILARGPNAAEVLDGAETMPQILYRAKKGKVVLYDGAVAVQEGKPGLDQKLLGSGAANA
ncbi:uncharacterized protein E0L32_006970 [Thyridium curvatum]|uniref:Uncharacterized protein n=1 Tax=Thyridium curvatum TaxID=1093900 RepID=A0A507AXF4_9PEZI|nr:uncharacterized protein E0L32_006970 [Thyridium curvatum]TPX12323.1 hypothetical protein E0L32_006970 [Thyridium curvatum]